MARPLYSNYVLQLRIPKITDSPFTSFFDEKNKLLFGNLNSNLEPSTASLGLNFSPTADITLPVTTTVSKGISGTGYNPNTSYLQNVFTPMLPLIIDKLNEALKNGNLDAVVGEVNGLQGNYASMRNSQNFDMSSPQFNQNVLDYQNQVKGFWGGALNNTGITNAFDKGRYSIFSQNPTSGDRPSVFNSDGYYGAITLDRTILGYKGDWDENSEEFKNWQNSLKPYNLEMYLDTDNAYKFREIPKPTVPQLPSAPQAPVETEPESTPTTPITPFKPNPWSDGIDIFGRNLINTAAINNIYSAAKKLPTILLQAPYKQFKVTDDYYNRASLEEQGKELTNQVVANGMTSDLSANQAMLQQAKNAQVQAMQLLMQTNKYNLDILHAKDVADYNNAAGTQIANENIVRNAAALEYLKNAKERSIREKALLDSDTLYSVGLSVGLLVHDNRLAKLKYDEDVAEVRASEQDALNSKVYYDFAMHPEKSQAFQNYYNNVALGQDKSEAAINAFKDVDFSGYGDYNTMIKNPTQLANMLRLFLNTNNTYNKSYQDAYAKELEKALYDYILKRQNLQNDVNKSKIHSNAFVNNQLDFFPWLRPKPAINYNKAGGSLDISVKTNKADSYKWQVLDNKYQRDNHTKQQHDINIEAIKRDLASKKQLKEALDRLLQEQLIILKKLYS